MKVIISPPVVHPNPYIRLLYKHMDVEVEGFRFKTLPRGGVSILHFHWPEHAFKLYSPQRWLSGVGWLTMLQLDAWRAAGTRIVWTIHNLQTHERRNLWLEKRCWKAFLKRVDGAISLTESGLEAAREKYPELNRVPCFVIPHGDYREAYPVTEDAAAARQHLGIGAEQRVVLFFGEIRDYKNVPRLIETFRQWNDPQLTLIVAGKPRTEALDAAVRQAAGEQSNIQLHLRFIPDAEVARYFAAADLVALPFREILNSGSSLLALSFDRPVLVPRKGALGEMAKNVGPEWVRTFDGELTVETLRDAVAWARGRGEKAPLEAYDWAEIARKTQAAYTEIAAKSR